MMKLFNSALLLLKNTSRNKEFNMKQFKEGQIVKATESTYYLEAGEIAEVKFTEGNPELCLVFYEGTDRESKWPCSETSPEFFDFYEKIA